jgi:hypothetical protein
MIDQVSVLSAGIVRQGYVGGAGGGPVYMNMRVEIVSPERSFHHSSSKDQGNGMILLFSSDRLGQWNVKSWSVVSKWAVTLKGEIGVNPLIPATLKGCAAIGLCN